MTSGAWLALDVGGANLKFAVAADRGDPRLVASGSLPFALWEAPDALPERLREVERRAAAGSPPAP